MKQKILILYKDQKEKDNLEEILSELVEKGVEIFFTDSTSNALEISTSEKPQLILIDPSFEGFTGATILVKPLNKEQILSICLKSLDLSEVVQELPM